VNDDNNVFSYFKGRAGNYADGKDSVSRGGEVK
jgi:hypothetical protein